MADIRAVMEEHVERGVPGLVWAVADGDDLDVGWAGVTERGGSRPVQRDTIFRIASMSKPVTAVAALQLVEDGVLALDDPIDELVPELANRRVLRDPQGPLDDTVPAHRAITLRDLLTFRLGIGMDFTRFGRQPLLDAMVEAGTGVGPPRPQSSPAPDEFVRLLGALPLEFQPGERWLYHLGSEVLSVLLARAAAKPLADLLRERIFEPLGMHDTGFFVPPEKLERFTDCSGVDESGESFVFDPVDGEWTTPPAFASGGGGLVSTVDDYLAFGRMLLAGGGPVLSRSSVEAMTTNQLTPEQVAASSPAPDGSQGWGFGCGIVLRQVDAEPVGAYGWSGGLGSSWTSDPVHDRIVLLLTNQMFTSPSLPPVHAALVEAAYNR